MTNKQMLRYLENDFLAKFAWSIQLHLDGFDDIHGVADEKFKAYDIRQAEREFEVMRSHYWDTKEYPFEFYQIEKRKSPDSYKATVGCKQFYLTFRKDWAMAQIIPADVHWVEEGNFLRADLKLSEPVELSPFVVQLTQAAECWGQACLRFLYRDSKAA